MLFCNDMHKGAMQSARRRKRSEQTQRGEKLNNGNLPPGHIIAGGRHEIERQIDLSVITNVSELHTHHLVEGLSMPYSHRMCSTVDKVLHLQMSQAYFSPMKSNMTVSTEILARYLDATHSRGKFPCDSKMMKNI